MPLKQYKTGERDLIVIMEEKALGVTFHDSLMPEKQTGYLVTDYCRMLDLHSTTCTDMMTNIIKGMIESKLEYAAVV